METARVPSTSLAETPTVAGSQQQHPIYFENIQMKRLQHTSEDKWNIWNMRLKHLQQYLKTLDKPLKNICNIQIKHLQHTLLENRDLPSV
jgi:hypothetical protein